VNEVIEKLDFAPDAETVRESVIHGGFSTERGPDGALYTGISKHQVPHWFDYIARVIGFKIFPTLSCFRLNLAGELPHSWVHSDDICAKYASVLYLNLPEQCSGGTAFWKHRTLGIDRLPSRKSLREHGVDDAEFYSHMDDEWKVLSAWEQYGFSPMKWNKFITYPTCLFHSRYPFEAFGKNSYDGRLIWICFYDIENPA
jgi:hypothetical protein